MSQKSQLFSELIFLTGGVVETAKNVYE